MPGRGEPLRPGSALLAAPACLLRQRHQPQAQSPTLLAAIRYCSYVFRTFAQQIHNTMNALLYINLQSGFAPAHPLPVV